MNSIELTKLDKLVKVSIDLLELARRLCPYIEDKDVSCIVIPMGRLCKLSWSGYPGRYESVEITLVGKTYQRIVQYDAARLKTAFNVVEWLPMILLKRSTDITM
jgi:hypothetical protein